MVSVFTKPGCVPCVQLKQYLNHKGISYEEKPINDHIQQLTDLGFTSAPVLKVGDTYLSGGTGNYSRIAELACC